MLYMNPNVVNNGQVNRPQQRPPQNVKKQPAKNNNSAFTENLVNMTSIKNGIIT